MFQAAAYSKYFIHKATLSESEVAQSCPTLCDPMDYSPPGSSVRGILQARILEWVAISFSRGSSQPRDRPGSPALQADALSSEPHFNTVFFFSKSWGGKENGFGLAECCRDLHMMVSN